MSKGSPRRSEREIKKKNMSTEETVKTEMSEKEKEKKKRP
jgi:hypothetical protein